MNTADCPAAAAGLQTLRPRADRETGMRAHRTVAARTDASLISRPKNT